MKERGSFAQQVVELYLNQQYDELDQKGLLGCTRSMIAHTLFTQVCEKRDQWKLAIPVRTDIIDLPYLSDKDKVLLYHIVAQQDLAPYKHLGRILIPFRFECLGRRRVDSLEHKNF